MNGTLILIRHGESVWNARNVWTGLTDIGLSEKGKEEAQTAARELHGIPITRAFTSRLSRAQQTLQIILEIIGKTDIPIIQDSALNERDYGDYTGKNKMEVKTLLGEDGFLALRRGWDVAVPHGESLKQVFGRVVPYYLEHIAPFVTAGESVLLVAHGNSLRALMKHIEHIADEDIAGVELKTGQIIVYEIASEGSVIKKETRTSTQLPAV